jgi:CheY-like chemotaxis protein
MEPEAARKLWTGGKGMSESSKTQPRILVVEDEYLIRMLLEDMLADLGYDIAAAVGTIKEANEFAANGEFDVAVLDVNLDGQVIYPVADILAKRGKPFVFVTGYGENSLIDPYRDRPALQKPFQTEQIKAALDKLLA